MSLTLLLTLAAGGLLFVFLLLLYVYLLTRKAYVRRWLRMKNQWSEKSEHEDSALTIYMTEGIWSRSIVPYKQLHYEALEELFSHRLKQGLATLVRQRIYDFANHFFVD